MPCSSMGRDCHAQKLLLNTNA
uniref:Uncharacterized protein n=1 Tax=Anguilla anguilla TaxID=7936 RepID=A0A0E9UP26_ANGAN